MENEVKLFLHHPPQYQFQQLTINYLNTIFLINSMQKLFHLNIYKYLSYVHILIEPSLKLNLNNNLKPMATIHKY